jgi:hypothetical protein
MQLLFQIAIVYKNDILEHSYAQTIFFKYFFNMYYFLKKQIPILEHQLHATQEKVPGLGIELENSFELDHNKAITSSSENYMCFFL